QSPFQFALYRGDTCVMRSVADDTLSWADAEEARSWRWAVELDGDDAIHGLGASLGELDRRGTVLVSDDPASRALPLLWSTNGWGLYFNTFSRVRHDVGQSDADQYRAVLRDPLLDLFIFVGEP